MQFYKQTIIMKLEKDEYCITHRIPCNTITITKQALEEWRDHYKKVASQNEKESFIRGLYVGKADVLIDILKHFDNEEYETV